MARQKTRRTMFIIGVGVVVVLVLIAGAVVFTLQKSANAGAASAPASTASANGSAQTIQAATTTTNNAAAQQTNPAATATVAVQVQVPGNPTSGTTGQQNNPAAPANGGNPAPNPTPANNGNPAPAAPQNVNLFAQPLKQYGPQIQHLIAQGLNILDKQLAKQLQAGKHLKDIAQAQGVADTQLQTLISTSVTNGFAPAVQGGQLNQTQVTSFVTQTQQDPKMLEQALSIDPPAPPHW